MDKLYIVIPTYNEEDNIKTVIKQWYKLLEEIGNDSKLVVINDGSTDKTLELMNLEAENKKDLICLSKPNSGHGATILYGYNYAIKQGADYIFQTDSDGQTLPSEFSQFWASRKQYDMLIGNRIKREDGISRVLVSKVLKGLLWMIFRVSIIDPNTPYRLMKTSTLKQFIGFVPENYNLTNVIISVLFYRNGCKVKFLPITFLPRQGGVNSINIPRIFKIGLNGIRDFIKINKDMPKKK